MRTLKTNSSKQALLFLSDTYYPEWKATVDGKQTKIYLADYAFRSVVIPAGNHEVIFEYVPNAFYKGLIVGGVGLIALLIVSLYIHKKIEN